MTAAAHVAVPVVLLAVPVNVVVMVGKVVVDPDVMGVTEPMPLSIENEVAFVVVHERIEESPLLIEVGAAVSVQTGAGGGGGVAVTVIAAAQVTVPPGPVAVPVKVVVVTGEMEVEPATTGVSVPTPLSIENDVVFAVVHESVELPPTVIEVGVATSVQTGAGGGGGGGATVTPVEQVV